MKLPRSAVGVLFALALCGGPGFALATPAPAEPTVTAVVALDERSVVLTADGDGFTEAAAVAFEVTAANGAEKPVVHGAVAQVDGPWLATVAIASRTSLEAGVPYHCQIPDALHRLYNPYEGLHLYTPQADEADELAKLGWTYEGVAWVTPPEDSGATVCVERFYNAYTGDHFYTDDPDEGRQLTTAGWTPEGAAFTSDPQKGQPIYRLFNPYAAADAHLFTTDKAEYDTLGAAGWRQEGVAFYGAASNRDGSWSVSGQATPHEQPGDYTVRAYALDQVGAEPTGEPLAETTFTIATPTAEASIAAIDDARGTFDVLIMPMPIPSGIASVTVNVSADDEGPDQARAYEAEPQEDGTYTATVAAENHNFAKAYTACVVIRAGNGVQAEVGTLHCALDTLSGDPELDELVNYLLDEVIGREGDALRRAYDYVAAYPYLRNDETPAGAFTQRYAREMYENHGGNCFRYASLFKWLARGLGYDARVVVGTVVTVSDPYAPHGWVEIADGDAWYLYDPDMAHGYTYRNFYHTTYDTAPLYYTIQWYC